ncbi:MAG: type IV pilus twitching motility protein PilT [Bacillota bacterium]|nr:type IV pilus twitching motility protein PilT [Bacillota bacterium]
MDINELLAKTLEMKASDLHITCALPPVMRINGKLTPYGSEKLNQDDTRNLCYPVMNEEQKEVFEHKGEVDFSYAISGVGRFRVNVYRQRNTLCAAFRALMVDTPALEELGLPPVVGALALKPRGLVLVTGPTGSGKSTTLASMVRHINLNRSCHILTLEEPIEYLHRHGKSMVNQREVGNDTRTFADGLRAALREDPDVIMVGEMRDLETIAIAISASETGHLVLSTLHTTGAAQTVDRIIDVFPPYQQQQIRVQLASVLQGVISQQLLPLASGDGRIAAFEIMVATDAIRNLIREGKTFQIPSMVQTGFKMGMIMMDYSLSRMVKQSKVALEEAAIRCVDTETFKRYLAQPNE